VLPISLGFLWDDHLTNWQSICLPCSKDLTLLIENVFGWAFKIFCYEKSQKPTKWSSFLLGATMKAASLQFNFHSAPGFFPPAVGSTFSWKLPTCHSLCWNRLFFLWFPFPHLTEHAMGSVKNGARVPCCPSAPRQTPLPIFAAISPLRRPLLATAHHPLS
jgi:hypothetical protein